MQAESDSVIATLVSQCEGSGAQFANLEEELEIKIVEFGKMR